MAKMESGTDRELVKGAKEQLENIESRCTQNFNRQEGNTILV